MSLVYIYINMYIHTYLFTYVCVLVHAMAEEFARMMLVRHLERIGFWHSRAFWFFRVGGELQPHLLKSDRLAAA